MDFEMNGEKHQDWARDPREGIFDAQLSLPALFHVTPAGLDVIVKRDGRQEEFDKAKIAHAIQKAAEEQGGYDFDRALNLASAVAIHLAKTVYDRLVTVDDIHAAVERVLTSMGHYRTATAYVRFRERRARLRHLRESRPSARGIAPKSEAGIQVRTSGETLEAWSRTRIIQALVRETELPEAQANRVASEVERQILAADVRTLTAPLVRELVTAKLIELGLEPYARRHRRLGVPLFDTESTICGPVPASGAGVTDPETTDWQLAESVKKEYALSEVFSNEVAEAHVLGDIHIHGLSMVDRLESASHSLELVKRFGMDMLGKTGLAGPPRALDVLSAEMAGMTMALQRHFYGTMTWRAANVFLAPFLEGLSDRELNTWAEMLLRDLAMGAAISGRGVPPIGLELWWEAPPSLASVEAVGAGGLYTGRAYKEYAFTIQKSAMALVDAFRDLRQRGVPLASPAPVLRISHGLLRDPGYETLLAHIAALAVVHPGTCIRFDRSEPWLVGEDRPWRSRRVSLGRVTLNLPRAAYRGGRDGVMAEVARLMPLVAAAHGQKYRLLDRILEFGESGPLALVTRLREGVPIHELEQAVCHVGVVGLNECVQYCLGHELHDRAEALEFGRDLLAALNDLCGFWSEQEGLTFVLAPSVDLTATRRLASLDLEQFEDYAARVIKSDTRSHEVEYTPGAEVRLDSAPIPSERVRFESRFHGYLRGEPATRIRVPDDETSPDSVAAFLVKTYRQTAIQRVTFV